MAGCYYASMAGQLFGAVETLPALVTGFLSVATLFTHAVIFFVYGLFLNGMNYTLWAFQLYFQYEHVNPICQVYHAFAFPSISAFYAGALAAGLISFSFLFGRVLTWFAWLILYCVLTLPLVLVWFSYNAWWEVLFSILLGVVSSILFILVVWMFITPVMPYLLCTFPCTLLGHTGYLYLTPKQLAEQEEIAECLARVDRIVATPAARAFRPR